MLRFGQIQCAKLLCLVWLSWAFSANAISLGSPRLLSKTGEPLKVEFPIKLDADEQGFLSSLNVGITNQATYERLGISKKLLELNPQAMIYRNPQEQLMVLLETVNPVPISDDPFLDVLLTLKWSSGSLSKTYTLLLGDVQKIVVRPGQTLSEIAAQLAPQLDGVTLDQAMLALFKANPDAFASGSINRLEAGAELNKPNQALLRSISPAEASQFVAESNAQWRAERDAKAGLPNNAGASKESVEAASKDRLKIGSSADGNAEERRFAEDLVAQERALEQTRAKVAELEKNIADLQALLDKAKGKAVTQPAPSSDAGYASYTPAAFALLLIALTGFLLWILAKNARRSEVHDFSKPAPNIPPVHKERVSAQSAMPERAKALFAGIDLDLSPAKTTNKTDSIVENPLADALRVKLNLARAYVTIEDFAAAKKSLQEIINIGGPIDPVATVEAQGLLLELSQRDS